MVEVFKTTVNNIIESHQLVKALDSVLPDARVNFDLGDCDNILRVEAKEVDIQLVREIMLQKGHHIELLK